MKKPSLKKLQKECDVFNEKYPVGTGVMLKKDFVDCPVKTRVKDKAFILSGHSAVAFFEGISGCYLISCVRGMATETGWVIENGKNAGKGQAYRFINNDKDGIPDWTDNNNKALRFARREDAEQFAYHDEDAWRIVEYTWG